MQLTNDLTTTTYTIVTQHPDGHIGIQPAPNGTRHGRQLCQRTHLRGGKTTLTAWVAHEPGLARGSIVKQAQAMWRRAFGGESTATEPQEAAGRAEASVQGSTPASLDIDALRARFWRATPRTVRKECEWCGESFEVESGKDARRRTCSEPCRVELWREARYGETAA